MMNTQLLENVTNYLKNITKEDKVCIIHDTDPDGICSAVIIAKCIERTRGKQVDIRIPLDKKQYGITPKMMKQIKKHKITKLITTDFSAEGDLKTLKEIEKQANILIIDHHKLYNKYDSPKTLLYKPQLFTQIEPSTYCTAKLAYDAANTVIDAEDLDWIAASACIADIATIPWQAWLEQVFKKYNIEQKPDLFQTDIGQTAATISSTEVYNIKLVPKCFEAFYQAKTPQDILHSKFGKYKKIIDKELQKHIKNFETKAHIQKDLHIYEMTSKYRVQSPLSTILGLKYPQKTIIIINKTHPYIAVSARRGDKTKPMNNLLENTTKGFKNCSAGGHTPAAGAGFPKKYLKTFKQRIKEEYK